MLPQTVDLIIASVAKAGRARFARNGQENWMIDSIIWDCPVCGQKIPMPISLTRYGLLDESAVNEHKRLHQQYGLVVN